MKLSGILLVLLLMSYGNAFATTDAAVKEKSKKLSNGQMHYVKQLLENSSAAKKVKNSDDMSVKSLYRASKDLYQKAVSDLENGDRESAGEALFYSTETMFRAVRLVNNQNNPHLKARQDFERRLKSINALLKALERISKEKGVIGKSHAIRNQAEKDIEYAQLLMKDNQPFSARKTLDKTYVKIKTAISELRSGDTLVRSLNFASKKEEYLYELDRNDTHKMLVTLLLEEKMKNPSTLKRVQRFLDKAAELRKKAEELASEGDYAAAVETCEESTKQLVRAIRSSGFFIPG